MCCGLMARYDGSGRTSGPRPLSGAARRAVMQRPRQGSKLALDGLGPANELVVELIISNTEGH